MKIFPTILCVAILLMAEASSHAQQPIRRGTMGYASFIRGQHYPLRLVDETFKDQPTYSPTTKSPPPLDMVAAYQLAYDNFLRVQEPNIQYEVENISLDRFHTTDWWFYVVAFKAVNGWETVEPYRTLLQNRKRDISLPCIQIIVLLTGDVLMPQEESAGHRHQSAPQFDP